MKLNVNHRLPYVMVALGRSRPASDADWIDSGLVRRFVRFQRAAPSGFRLSSRIFGLGLDSAIVAAKVAVLAPRGPYLAANPWLAVALRLVGKRRIAVTGIYAENGSRSFRLLRRFLGDAPVLTLVRHEAESWNAAGGRATPVIYGNTFGYPYPTPTRTDGRISIFIGGSSDRDPAAIQRLENELREADAPIDLVIVSKEEPSAWSGHKATITRTGYVSADDFGRLISVSDVVYLPLSRGHRAAGHMVAVGALEAGTPVVCSDSPAMTGYVDGTYIRSVPDDDLLLPHLQAVAEWGRDHREAVRAEWAARYSHRAYVERVAAALKALS
ncbi:glycosyltransferase [Agreia pratensis]|uniref:glycosyltransferase n=1 Tax=Agreia pratensis TaxID=150121 RepID=UPI00188B4427|nr:glycosyltransferase [Agreia pratensis]MBF4633039.1 glycosyltransferase [Agreia pratensis]